MENQIEIKGEFIIVEGRKLKIASLIKLLRNSDTLSEYSDAINRIVFSVAQAASFILTCPTINDDDRSRAGEGMPAPDAFFSLETLAETLKQIEK
ncbi:hypothetical protein [Gaoshiqia sp. Z1-71]|uniref:hypothetical protein n=1 Tax=Gaoshiqia hydrogeniformans TaxID=3290090 RepID=UPI003BF86A89